MWNRYYVKLEDPYTEGKKIDTLVKYDKNKNSEQQIDVE
jgi:hypothetical protein